ncbi:MAG: hypothetical protein KDD60_05615 [Bdellovibrionales bacterium]|nr:hypothetical protein [Bdellovibrionales bacterium]
MQVLLISAIALAFFLQRLLLPYSPAEIIAPSPTGVDYLLTNLYFNSYLVWRPDIFLGGIEPSLYYLLSLVIFTIGIFFLRQALSSTENRLISFALACWIGGSVQILVGSDRVVLGCLTWWPWLIAVIVCIPHCKNHILTLPAIAAFSWLVAHDSSVLAAPISILTLWLLASCLRATSSRHHIWFYLALLLPTCIELWYLPPPPWPEYPGVGAVVQDDGVPGIVRPLVGFDAVIPCIDRNLVKSLIWWPASAVLLLLALISFFEPTGRVQEGSSLRLSRSFVLLSIIMFFCSLLDLAMPEGIAIISPLATASRILPFASLYPLVIPALAIGIIAFGVANNLIFASVTLALFSFGMILHAPLPSQKMRLADIPYPSPSAPLFARYGLSSIQKFHMLPPLQELSLNALPVKLSSSRNSEELELLRDVNLGTRWSNKRGSQLGDEFITLELEKPLEIYGLNLDPGIFWSDFPGGIIVRGSFECHPRSETGSSDWKVLASESPWLGTVSFTPEGAPYYGKQSKVVLHFHEPHTVACIRIEQTGVRSGVDWSIAELSLLVGGTPYGHP